MSARELSPARSTPNPRIDARDLVPRLALSKAEAAAAIGASVDFLEEHVLGELRVVRRGRRVFIPIAELSRWLDRNAALTVEGR
jgi:hypothetical protein